MNNLTERKYWDDGYLRTDRGAALPDLDDFRHTPDKRIVEALEALDLKGKVILELGAGDSDILLILSRRWGSVSRFVGLDYSDTGCTSLSRRANAVGVDVSVVQADMFCAPKDLTHKFDIVYSVGLVEHFAQLESVLACKRRFLKPGGVILTVIPNMSGLIGKLAKRFNKAVYDIHNPHNMRSFLDGHARAGLEVVRSGYLCSTNFGVLSACFEASGAPGWKFYVFLSRLSKASWLFESKITELPKTAFLSPYLYAVSHVKAGMADDTSTRERSEGGAGAGRCPS
ncbi:MAG: class I SAM-dependent methyltransferase [Steroidobacteraceae bacterium]